MGGWETCSILRGEENARIGVLSSGLDVLILLFVLLYVTYVLLSFCGIPECVVEVCVGPSGLRCSGRYE